MDRKVWSFALVSVAVTLRRNAEQVADAQIVLGGIAPIPWRVREAEQVLIGQAATSDQIDRAVATALASAQPLAHNRYKVSLAQSLLRRALLTLTERTDEQRGSA